MPDEPHETLIELLVPGEIKIESRLRSLIRRLFRRERPPVPVDVEGKDWLTAHSAQISRATLNARLSIVRQFDSRGWLSEIEVPTLAIVGAQDRPEFLSAAQTLYEGIPQCQLEVVEDCDHYCFFTRFDIVDDLIDNFIKENLSKL
jgi:pimeloyl-ACP methyl ester carboxylesterase